MPGLKQERIISMEKQAMIPNGNKWFNGVVLNDQQTKVYNNYTKDLNRYVDGGSDTFKDRINQILDARHEYINIVFDCKKQNS